MEKLRWGLIGCGDIARKRVAPALRDLDNCDFTAVVRAQYEHAEAFAKEFGALKWYRTVPELLADDGIDAVYIATPVNQHCEQTIATAQAGKHVLCEKPMGMNTGECDRMAEACRINGVALGIAYYRHFYPVIGRIREIIASGEVGAPVFSQINAFEYFNPPPGSDRRWFVERAISGGGPMFDFGCHRIEVLMHLFGKAVFAAGYLDTLRFEREVEDTGTAFLRFGQGVNAVLNVTHASFEPQDTLDIFCTDGSLHVPALNSGVMTVLTARGSREEHHPPHANIHLPLIDDFTRAVLEGRPPAVGYDIGREVNRIEEELYRG